MKSGKAATSTISEKGQTTIPISVRKKLGVKEGDVLFYDMGDGSVRLRKIQKIDTHWTKALESTVTEWTGTTDDDL